MYVIGLDPESLLEESFNQKEKKTLDENNPNYFDFNLSLTFLLTCPNANGIVHKDDKKFNP